MHFTAYNKYNSLLSTNTMYVLHEADTIGPCHQMQVTACNKYNALLSKIQSLLAGNTISCLLSGAICLLYTMFITTFLIAMLWRATEYDLFMRFLKLRPIILNERSHFRGQVTMRAEGLPKALSVKGWVGGRDISEVTSFKTKARRFDDGKCVLVHWVSTNTIPSCQQM